MKVLCAGGTGRLGRVLVPLLRSHGAVVRVIARDTTAARARFGDDVEIDAADVRDRASLDRAISGVDAVVSAVTGFGSGMPGPRAVDFAGNVNLIRAAESAGVSRFVLVSVVGAAPHHPMELLRMKYAAERALMASYLDWRIVRPTTFLELWSEIVGEPIRKNGTTTVFGRGDNPINFVSIAEVARAVADALVDDMPSRSIVEVGGPRNLTLNQLAEEIARAAGCEPRVRHVPVAVMRVSRMLLKRLRPDIAGMIEAGITMDTADMTFEPTGTRLRVVAG